MAVTKAVTKKETKKPAVSAFMAAAVALPGVLVPSVASSSDKNYQADYSFARYDEGATRMGVRVHNATFTAKLTDQFTLKVNAIKDMMSGASPAFNRFDANGNPVQVVTNATIRDTRDEADVGIEYTVADNTVEFALGTSDEDDYRSKFVSANVKRDINNKNTTLALGFGYSSDDVGSVLDATKGGNKVRREYMAGITQIIDKHSLVQTNVTYTRGKGYLTDPYKLVFINGVGVRGDNRPGERDQWAVLGRYVRYFEQGIESSLHVDYRFYTDDWGIDAHTLQSTWKIPFNNGWQFDTRIRYYSQTNADFYQTVFTAQSADGLQSSDYRLAAYGVVSGDVMLTKYFDKDTKIRFGVEHSDRQYDFALQNGRGSDVQDYDTWTYKIAFKKNF